MDRNKMATLPDTSNKAGNTQGLIVYALSPLPLGNTEQMDGKVRCACGRVFRPDHVGQRFCDHACYSASIRVPIEQRFWTKVNKQGPPPAHLPHLGGCWLWTAKARLREYGSIAGVVNGKRRPLYTHRVSWELAYGAVPDGLSVLHRCDTPLCVRPDHLFLGTQQDNLNDARAKGRLVDGLAARKLSDAAYADILSAPTTLGTGVALAAKHGVTEVTVSRIRRRKQGSTFHHLTNVEPVSPSESAHILGQFFQASRQHDQPRQSVALHIVQSAVKRSTTVSPHSGQ